MVRLSLFWVCVFTLVHLIEVFLFSGDAMLSDEASWQVILSFVMIGGLIKMVGLMEMAMGWHRYALLREEPASFVLAERHWPHLPFFWKLVQVVLAVFVLVILPLTAISVAVNRLSFMADVDPFDHKYQILLDFLLGPVAVWLILHLGLILPAAAVHVNMSLRRSLQLTRSMAPQLLILAVLISLYSLAADTLGDLLMAVLDPASNLFLLLAVLVNLPVGLIGFFLAVAILNNLFQMLYEEEPSSVV